MKRSEMVNKIKMRLQRMPGLCSLEDKQVHIEADFLLSQLEQMGMLPPQRLQKHMINEIFYVNSWEDEEE